MSNNEQKIQRYQQGVEGQNSQGENKSEIGQVKYQDFTKSELIKHLKSKDKIISELKQTFKNQSKGDKDKINLYRTKLEQQILHNQKAVKSFENITQTVVQIIKKYQFLDQATRQTVKNVVQGIRETCSQAIKQHQNDQQQPLSDVSEFSCMQEIVNETSKLLSYLSKLTDENVKVVVRLKAELANTKDRLASMSNYEVVVKKNPNDQMEGLKDEINQLIIQNKNLNNLLKLSESEKNKILMSICTVLTEQQIEHMNKLAINELVEKIKHLTYRIKQIKRDKQQILKRSQAQNEQNKKKLFELQDEVKKVRILMKHSIQKKMILS